MINRIKLSSSFSPSWAINDVFSIGLPKGGYHSPNRFMQPKYEFGAQQRSASLSATSAHRRPGLAASAGNGSSGSSSPVSNLTKHARVRYNSLCISSQPIETRESSLRRVKQRYTIAGGSNRWLHRTIVSLAPHFSLT